MSETLFAALIGVGGAILGALLTAFLQPVWETLLSKRSHLGVRARICDFAQPEFLSKAITEYRLAHLYSPSTKLKDEREELLRTISKSKGFVILYFRNHSRKRISGIALTIKSQFTDTIMEIERGGQQENPSTKKCVEIGSLQPGEECEVRIWTSPSPPDYSAKSLREFFHVTADEYDRISFVIERPKFINGQYFLLRKGVVWTCFWLFLIALNVLVQTSARGQ